MEFNNTNESGYARETIIPEEEILMAIKTEPEVIIEHEEETGKRLLELEEDDDDGPTSCKNFKYDFVQTDEPELSNVAVSTEVGIDPAQSLLFEKYFTIIEEANVSRPISKRDKISAKCLTCNKVLAGTLRVTSNFLRHMRKLHCEKYTEYEELKQEAKLTSTKQDHFDKLILAFIAKNMLPVSILETDSFKSLLNFSNPKLTVMNKATILKLMDTTIETFKNNLRQIVNCGGYFCSTADIWSTKHRTFFGYTIHWITDTFERKSVAVACKQFSDAPTFATICCIINEIHADYAIDICNMTATTTDTGINLFKALSEFGIVNHENFLSEDEEVFEIDQDSANRRLEWFIPNHIKCASHTLKLIATTDFNRLLRSKTLIYDKHKQILKKCSTLWAKAEMPKCGEKIVSILGCHLKYPVITRWNSLYDSIKDLVSHRLKLFDLCIQLDIEEFRDKEIDYLAEYVEVLQPIAEALEFFQSDDGMMFGYLLPSLATIITKYTKIQLWSNSNYLKTVAGEMIDLVKTRFASYVTLDRSAQSAIVASVLCPAVKFLWVKALSPEFNVATEAKIINIAKEAVVAISGKDERLKPHSSDANISSYFNFSIAEDSEEQSCDTPSAPETEFLAYLTDTSKSLNMLNKYPLIKKAFIKYNTPLPSSAASKRLFAAASVLNAPRGELFSDENFEKLLLLNVNNAL